MNGFTHQTIVKELRLGLAILAGLALLVAVLLIVSGNPLVAHADPIPPEEGGHPKLSLSVKTVTPTLAGTTGMMLSYAIEIRNTGAYTAYDTVLTDDIPDHTTYISGTAQASVPPTPTVAGGTLTWIGDVGFDATVVVSFSVFVEPGFMGTVRNSAVINHPLIAQPVTETAETVVTDQPILVIEKTSAPAKPGANKPLVYTLVVGNQGWATPPGTSIMVTDRVPLSTTVLDVGMGGITGTVGSDVVVTWTKQVALELHDTVEFTFSVEVDDVPSGTVITNDDYAVSSKYGVKAGDPYTVTIIDPILSLSKYVWPDPPGSNREMTYTLRLLNVGSLATDLVITDRLPAGAGSYFRYVRGGVEDSGVVSWSLPSLDTGEWAEFTYTIYISDVMGIPIVNSDYVACPAEVDCEPGKVLTSVVQGPTFEAFAVLYPIAKKPGGGGGPVTPTLIVHNLGPGNAINATALLKFIRISVSNVADLEAIPPEGTLSDGPDCGDKCFAYIWVGNLGYGDMISFTTTVKKDTRGRSTIGGEEGTVVTATVTITDNLSLNDVNTEPVSDTANTKITHLAYLNAVKSALRVIGPGQVLTYTINVWNSALSTENPPPFPYLWEVLTPPISGTTVITDSISHGGQVQTATVASPAGSVVIDVISWTLPALSTGELLEEPRSFAVRVDSDLVSGTQIVNDNYLAYWYENDPPTYTGWFSSTGRPVTTTVKDVGLIHSYKEVTPTLVSPGPGNVLTYYLHIVNSSAISLSGVTVYDYLPWQPSTYQRDAVASAGQVVSDIVSIEWTGSVDAFSEEVVTLTVLVDEDYHGPVTNTAVISHPQLVDEVEVQAVAYVTDKPVLQITKRASPDPVDLGDELRYTIRVVNQGQLATSLVITDTVPGNTTIITDRITAPGEFDEVSGQVRWEIDFLEPGKGRILEFWVTVDRGTAVRNALYTARCAEGVVDVGEPVITPIVGGRYNIYLPLVLRNA